MERLNVGELIEVLGGLQKTDVVDLPIKVFFDFAGFFPAELDSYRGYYEDLALGFTDEYEKYTDIITIDELIAKLKESVNKTYHGWKGGKYTMNSGTKLWVANSGNCGDTAITGATVTSYGTCILSTGHFD